MSSTRSVGSARRLAMSLVLAGSVVLIQAVGLPSLLAQENGPAGEGPKREYVPIVPEAEVGALPEARALPLTFDAEAGVGKVPLEIVPVGFWKSRLALEKVDYDLFEFEIEAPSHLAEVGEPNVPVQVLEVDIPPDAELDEVVLKPELLKTLENVALAPNQEPKPIGGDELIFEKETFTKDARLYEDDAAYPGKFYEVTATGRFGGRKTVILKTFPVQFYPAAKRVEFYKLTGALKFKATEIKEAEAGPEAPGPEARVLGSGAANVADAGRWEEYTREVGPELLEQFRTMRFHEKIDEKALAGIPCVIICADLFYCPAQALAAHRTAKGTPTAVVRARAIDKAIGGKDAPDKIRNFIRVLHRYYQTKWIVLFGDVVCDDTRPFVHVPTRMAVDPAPYSSVDDGWIPCDFYYACLDGTWDANNNGKYAELADKPDLLPELCVGRIPTNDFDDAYRIVNAIIRYENSPPKPKGALLAANDLGWGCHELIFKGQTVLPLLQSCGLSPVTQLYQKKNNLTVSTFAKVVNGGIDFIEYYGHGSPGSTQLMSSAQVQSMLNTTPSFPVVFALSCSTSRYDCQECFGEAWADGAKASAYIGSTRVAYGGTSSGEGLDVRFIRNYGKLGKTGCALDLAKYQLFKDFGWNAITVKTILEFTLFGDPVMSHVK